jgi:HD-GYP domain-containing protein (c-di-GMP phosphodiesterase class II)
LLTGEGIGAYFAAPLVSKGQVKGVLQVFLNEPFSPASDWLDFLETLAGQAAIAIENAELFDSLERSNAELTIAYDTTLESIARALELHMDEPPGHTRQMAEQTVELGRALHVRDEELVHIYRGVLLHDFGLLRIPPTVRGKPGPLTAEEWEVIQQHPDLAHEILSPIAYLRPALKIPYAHHEKWDGSGYPRGLVGNQIPLAARIFAVVDVWNALQTDRPHRVAWTAERALAYLKDQSGVHFDPRVVDRFLVLVDENPGLS